MEPRRPQPVLVAVVVLSALAPLLGYTVGGIKFEFAQLVALAVLVVALVELARGSRGAWSFLVFLNALPLGAAVMIIFTDHSTIATDLIILVCTSAPLMVVLLSPQMRRYLRGPASQHPAKPLAS
jgi:hypothetical protein